MNIRIKDKRKRQKMKDYFKNTVYGSMYQDMRGGTKVQIGGPRTRKVRFSTAAARRGGA